MGAVAGAGVGVGVGAGAGTGAGAGADVVVCCWDLGWRMSGPSNPGVIGICLVGCCCCFCRFSMRIKHTLQTRVLTIPLLETEPEVGLAAAPSAVDGPFPLLNVVGSGVAAAADAEDRSNGACSAKPASIPTCARTDGTLR